MMGVLERLELPPMGSHELGTEKTPVDHYISPEFFELEKRHIFAKSWLMVGRESDVRNPGDYVLHQVEPLSASVIIVRGKDAVLRAFHNACSHRGAQIVNAPCGKARGGLVCPFHGWAYGFDGKLLNVPAQETFGSLNLDDEKLRPVSVDVWGGFVFINLDPSPVHSLHEYFAQLGDAFDRYLANPKWSWSYGWRSSFKANWKFHIDAQVEGYHVDQNHRNTIGGNIPSDCCRPYAFPDSVGVPGGVGVYLGPDPTAGLHTPVATLSARFGATSPYTKPEKRFEADGGEGVLRTEHPLWVFDNYLLFPNVSCSCRRGSFTFSAPRQYQPMNVSGRSISTILTRSPILGRCSARNKAVSRCATWSVKICPPPRAFTPISSRARSLRSALARRRWRCVPSPKL